jgi:hypothetical protein
MLKFYCDIEGLNDSWIGMAESWTQRESKEAELAMGSGWKEYLPVLGKKVEACNIVVGDTVISDFSTVTEEVVDQMDLRMVGFLGGLLQQTVIRLRALGNANARVLSSANAGKS